MKLADSVNKNTEALFNCEQSGLESMPHSDGRRLPCVARLQEIITTVRESVFPGFFSDAGADAGTQRQHISTQLFKLHTLLTEQIRNSLLFFPEQSAAAGLSTGSETATAEALALSFADRMPRIKSLLCTDVQAMYDNDPAATCREEVILCYPSIQAMIHYRAAHELLLLGIPVLPRIITELAHSATGIDIHPGAQIGEYFSIDHGTGVVIGETSIIGRHVHLYKGVTLGARNIVLDESGNPLNTPRHPIIEDNVVIYSNATVLGRITIGHDSVIGGNVWLTASIPPHSRIVQHKVSAAGK